MGCTGSKDGHSLKLTKPPAQEGVTHCGPWLKHIDDLKGYPVFPAEYQSSALCKDLTKDVWEKYHGKKDAAGVPFEQPIRRGGSGRPKGSKDKGIRKAGSGRPKGSKDKKPRKPGSGRPKTEL